MENTTCVLYRQLPGSPLSVCEGDRVVVDLVNKLPSTTTSIHWHGLYMHGQPMDGKFTVSFNIYRQLKVSEMCVKIS